MISTLVLASADASAANPLGSLIPFLLIGGLFYFLLIRPQRKRQADQQAMLRRIGVGDEIVTIGGFYGTVTDLDEDTMVVTLAPGIEVKMARTSVSRSIGEPTGGILSELDDDDDIDDFDDDDFDDEFDDEFDEDVMGDISKLDGSHDAIDDGDSSKE